MSMTPVPDPYRLLGVKRGATVEEIKAAHRSLAKRYHPDAAESDTRRFLAVQEAYQLLTDPLRRREWDERHAPGPVRAAEGVTTSAASGRRARGGSPAGGQAAGRGTGATATPGGAGEAGRRAAGRPSEGPADDEATPGGNAGGPWTASDRDPATRSYTWSAQGVPWWEDHGPREARRPPGTKRPSGAPPRATGHAGARRSGTTAGPDQASGRSSNGEPPVDAHRQGGHDPGATTGPGSAGTATGRAPGRPEGAESTAGPGSAAGGRPTSEFDVYSRSSGAAWSSASRAYFRRSDAELPRRGVFRMEGTTPVTGAAARRAAEQEAARARGPGRPGLAGDGPGHIVDDDDDVGDSGAERTWRSSGSAPAPASAPGRPDPAGHSWTTSRPDTPGSAATHGRSDPLGRADPPGRVDPPGHPNPLRRADPPGRPDTPGRSDPPGRADTPGRSDPPGRVDPLRRADPPGRPDQARPASAGMTGDRATAATPSGARRVAPPPATGQRDAPRAAAPPGWSVPSPGRGGSTTTLGTMADPSLTASFRAVFERREPWPTIGERITFATLAWVPFALLVAYGGGWISGCDRAAASCTAAAQPVQNALIAASLVSFVLLSRVAYLATWGALGLAVTGLVLAVPATLLGDREQIPALLVALGLGMLAAGYVAGAVLAARDRPLARPWTLPARRPRSRPPGTRR